MKGFVLIADAARAHPDGTFSLLRGGIDRVHVPRTQPIQFRGSLIARIRGTLAEAGEHQLRLRVLNDEGKSLIPDISGQVIIPEGGGASVAVIDFGLIFPSYGRYSFVLLVDKQEIDVWEVRALEAKPVTGGEVQP